MGYFRAVDLNDYSLGVRLAGSANPYAGTDTNVYGYPYLTTFRDAAFTRDWLLLRESQLGIRWVSETNWEFALSGRVQTRGTGADPGDALTGIDSRKWALELGPSVTWRGWPVHVRLGVLEEISGRHRGYVGELALSVPFEWRRGFVVPTVASRYESDDYAGYYANVSPDEAAGLRPAYTAEAARNTSLRVRWGYELSERWLLSGTFGVEILDDTLSDSPIIDEDALWSMGVGLAWNADLFQPRSSDASPVSPHDIEITLGVFQSAIDTEWVHESGGGAAGSRIDLEDALGLSDSESVLRTDVLWRIGHYHRLEAGYYEWSREGLRVIDQDVRFGNVELAAGSNIVSQSESSTLRVAYGYSLIRDEQKELGVLAGVHLSSVDLSLGVVDGALAETGGADKPMPVIGAFGSLPLGSRTIVGARASVFALEVDRFDGVMVTISADVRRQIGERFSAGLAWHIVGMRLDTGYDNLRGSLEFRHGGPALFVTAGF